MSGISLRVITTTLWRAWYRFFFYADVFAIVRLLQFRKLRKIYYKDLWQSVAEKLGAGIHHDEFGYTRICRNGLVTFVKQYYVMLEDHMMLKVMGDKGLTYSILSEMGFPLPRHLLFSMQNLKAAEDFLATEKIVVVKPSSGTGGGRGVTTGIDTISQLTSAARLASRFDDTLIIEEQLEGASFRLLYLDGKLIDAIRRDPPVVTGDGVSTIKKLVKQENSRRKTDRPFRALSALVLDKDARNWMREAGISLGDIPEAGQIVQIKRAVNENDRSGNVNVTARIHGDIANKCEELVRKLGAMFVGVDIICKDIAQPFTPENCRISEINTTPGLHHHYLLSNPQDIKPVPETVIDYMLSNHVGVMEVGETKDQVQHIDQSLVRQTKKNQSRHIQPSGGLMKSEGEVVHEHP
ncbi:MAG: hypothetical protein JKX70_03575 [Phycisphaerales bacterium]|nr:hypothetical protein [Phycisphaerales bacterium]